MRLLEARGGDAARGGGSLARDLLRVSVRAHASSARWLWASARRSWKCRSSLRRRGPRVKARGSPSAGTRPYEHRCGARPRPREEDISRYVIPTSARETRARNSRASSLVPSDASPPTLGKSVVRYATGSLFASPYPHLPDRRRARTLEMWLALRNQRVKLHLFSGFVAPRSAPKRPARALPAPSLSPIHALFFRREFGQPADRRSPRPRSRVVLQRRGQRCVPGRRRESRKCGHRRP